MYKRSQKWWKLMQWWLKWLSRYLKIVSFPNFWPIDRRKSRLMKSELSLLAKISTFPSQFPLTCCCNRQNFSTFFNFKKLKDGLEYVNHFNWLWWIPCGAIIQRAKPTTTPQIFSFRWSYRGCKTKEVLTIFSVTFPEPDIVTLDDDFNDTHFHTGLGHNNQLPRPV